MRETIPPLTAPSHLGESLAGTARLAALSASVIHAEVRITNVAEPHELLDGAETVGKVVLRIR